ncbi:MAG: Maf family protein [Enhydrobacter sp.]
MAPVTPSPHILASTSSSRRQLMANAGLSFEIDPSGVDEEEVTRSLLAQRSSPQEIAEALAEMKALRVSSRRPGAFVVGGDSTLASNGRLFNKPSDMAAARKQLLALRGQTHELFSSVVVAKNGARLWHWNERARLTMRPFNEAFLDTYLARAGDAVLTSVGAYQLEGLGAHLFSRVDGDYFTILGLPLLPLLSFLAGHGVGLDRAA